MDNIKSRMEETEKKKGIKDYRTIGINLYNNSDKTH